MTSGSGNNFGKVGSYSVQGMNIRFQCLIAHSLILVEVLIKSCYDGGGMLVQFRPNFGTFPYRNIFMCTTKSMNYAAACSKRHVLFLSIYYRILTT